MDFSVVVPYYNAEAYLERCIEALVAQTYPGSFEIILVDNNSRDGSARIVSRYDGRVHALSEAKQGSYAARNHGVASASGDIIAFTDPDCAPEPDWLARLAEAMRDPQVGIVLGERKFAVDTPVLSLLAAYESELTAHIYTRQRVESYFAYTNNMAVRRRIFKDDGGFLELLRGADSQFLRNAVSRYGAGVVKHAPEALLTHLEIATVGDYLEKKRIYGGVTGNNQQLGVPTAVPASTRLSLAWQVLRRNRSALLPAISFLFILCAGVARFQLGRMRR